MFKRLAKKREREEDEEASGLKDIKALLGLEGGEDEISGESDTDSDDDDDDSDDDSEAGDDDEEDKEGISGEDDESDAENGSVDDEMDEDEDEEGISFDSPIPIPLAKITNSPLYPDPTNPAFQACILCPSRQLKNQKMTEVHLASKPHLRSLSRFEAYLDQGPPSSQDGRVIVAELLQKVEAETRKMARMKEMYNAELKSKSKEKASMAKAARLAKRALKQQQPAEAPAADAEAPAAAVASTPKPQSEKASRLSQEDPSASSSAPVLSKREQKRQERRNASTLKKHAARETARQEAISNGTAVLPPPPPKKRKNIKAAAESASGGSSLSGVQRRGVPKSKGGELSVEEAKRRTAEGRAKKAAMMAPKDEGWKARSASATEEKTAEAKGKSPAKLPRKKVEKPSPAGKEKGAPAPAKKARVA